MEIVREVVVGFEFFVLVIWWYPEWYVYSAAARRVVVTAFLEDASNVNPLFSATQPLRMRPFLRHHRTIGVIEFRIRPLEEYCGWTFVVTVCSDQC